jgi:hypothetical protein
MSRLQAIVLGLVLFCAFPAVAKETDGKIIWSVVTVNEPGFQGFYNGFEAFTFHFRSRDGKHRDYAIYDHGGLIAKGSDFENQSNKGAVQILSLAPGDWDFVSYTATTGTGTIYISPKKDFSVPITVKPGQAIYIGCYTGHWTFEENFVGLHFPSDIKFDVSDEGERDIAIAKKKDSSIGTVETQIPDYGALQIENIKPATPARPSP